MNNASYAAHRLIQQLFRDPDQLEQLRKDPEALFDAYNLCEEEKAALRDGSFTALERVGIHPILRMHYLLASNPAMASHVSAREFLPQILEGTKDG